MGNIYSDLKIRLGLAQKEKPEFRHIYIGSSRRLPKAGKKGRKNKNKNGAGIDPQVEYERDAGGDNDNKNVLSDNDNDEEDNVVFERKGSMQWEDERVQHHTEQDFPSNIIISSRYTLFNFIPKNLFEQFRRVANFWFLCMAIVQLTIESPVEPITSVLPLIFVIGITMAKQGYEDYLRHVADRQVNNRIVSRLSHKGTFERVKSKDLKCGDIVYSPCESKFPCDLVLLASSEPDAKAQVQTANLDGETNLKVIKSPGLPSLIAGTVPNGDEGGDNTDGNAESSNNHKKEDEDLDSNELAKRFRSFRAHLECEQPTHDLYKFRGNLHCINPDTGEETIVIPVSEKNLLLGGARLKNTGFTFGACVYTGRDSKMALNSLYQSTKFSTLEKTMNRFLLVCLITLASIVILLTALRIWFVKSTLTGKADYFLDGAHEYGSGGGGISEPHTNFPSERLFKANPILAGFVNTSIPQLATDAFQGRNNNNNGAGGGPSIGSMVLRTIEDALAFIILFNVIIPISLYVTVEVQRFLGSRFVAWDTELYDAQRDQPAKVNSSDMNEELGQIDYLFSDKTGTLTENDMRFRKCSIRGQKYEEKRSSGFLMREPEQKKGAQWQVMGEVEEEDDDEDAEMVEEANSKYDADITSNDSGVAANENESSSSVGGYYNAAHEGTDDERSGNNRKRRVINNNNNNGAGNRAAPPPANIDREVSTATLPARIDDGSSTSAEPPRPRSQSEGVTDLAPPPLASKQQQEQQQAGAAAAGGAADGGGNKTWARNTQNKFNLVDVYNTMKEDSDFELFFLGLVLCHSLYVSRADSVKPDAGEDGDEGKKKAKKKTTAAEAVHSVVKTGQQYLIGEKNPIVRLVGGALNTVPEETTGGGGAGSDGEQVPPMDDNDKRRVAQEVNESFKQLEKVMRHHDGAAAAAASENSGEAGGANKTGGGGADGKNADDDDGDTTKLAVFETPQNDSKQQISASGGAGAGGAHPSLMKMKSYAGGGGGGGPTAASVESDGHHTTADSLLDSAMKPKKNSQAPDSAGGGEAGGVPNISTAIDALGLETSTNMEAKLAKPPTGTEADEIGTPRTIDTPLAVSTRPQPTFFSNKSYIDKGVAIQPRGRAKHSRATSVTGKSVARSLFYAPQDVPAFDSLAYEGASPDEKSLVEACARMGIYFLGQVHEQPGVVAVKIRGETGLRRYKMLHTLEFDNDRRRMSVIVKRVYNKEDAIDPAAPGGGAGAGDKNAAAAAGNNNNNRNSPPRKTDAEMTAQSEVAELGHATPPPPPQQDSPAKNVQKSQQQQQPPPSTDNNDNHEGSKPQPIRGTLASSNNNAGGNGGGAKQSSQQPQQQQQQPKQPQERITDIMMFTKGADSNMLPIGTDGEVKVTSRHVDDYSMQGLRCLVMGMKAMSEQDYVAMKSQLGEAEQNLDVDARDKQMSEIYTKYESDLRILGTTAVEDRLQEHVHQTLRDLRSAGIKVFVLTGDKIDTAVQIAHSCGHFQRGMYEVRCATLTDKEEIRKRLEEIIEIVSHDKPPAKAQNYEQQASQSQTSLNGTKSDQLLLKNGGAGDGGAKTDSTEDVPTDVPFKGYWMLLDGVSLTTIFTEPALEKLLTRACTGCVAVLTCRCAPIQKAQIVRLMKNIPSKPTTAAVGDGANDVSMIQEAHVGLGIFGKEGRQAARSADFSLSRFHHLRRLLLVHGHWFYIRIAILVCYFFYKNFAMVLPQVFYTFDSAFSEQSLYDGFYLTFYNMIFTTLPILLFGLIEQHWNALMLLRYPELYAINAKNVRLSWAEFFKWAMLGVWHGVVSYYGAKFILWRVVGDAVMPGGQAGDNVMFGAYVGLAIVVITNLRLALETRHWTWPTLGGFVITFAGYFILNIVYTAIMWVPLLSSDAYHYVWFNIMRSPLLMLGLLALIAIAFLPDLVIVTLERHSEWLRAAREAERMGRTLKMIPVNEANNMQGDAAQGMTPGLGGGQPPPPDGGDDVERGGQQQKQYGTFDKDDQAVAGGGVARMNKKDSSAAALHEMLPEQAQEVTRHHEVLMPSDGDAEGPEPKDLAPGGAAANTTPRYPAPMKRSSPAMRGGGTASGSRGNDVVWGSNTASRQKSRMPPPTIQRTLSRVERKAYKRAMTARGFDADQTPPGSPTEMRTFKFNQQRSRRNDANDDDEDDDGSDNGAPSGSGRGRGGYDSVQYRNGASSSARAQQQQQQASGSATAAPKSPTAVNRWKFT